MRPLMETAYVSAQIARPVVMVSSIAGITGSGSSIAYAASKGALNTMTKSLARTLAPAIRVNVVCPGFIDTPWFVKGVGDETTAAIRETVKQVTPLKAASTAEDIADTIIMLCLPHTRHVTGSSLTVDAGLHLAGPA